jgi:hypothetical protein
MAPKPKKSANKPYKPNIYEQYENRRSFIIDTVETPADRKNLKKDLTPLLTTESLNEGLFSADA